MYFVDRKNIFETVEYIELLLKEVETQSYNSLIEKLALERIVQLVIEGIIDVGNMMIDGFIMRDPGSYEDIIDILCDEKVLPYDEMEYYKEVVNMRNKLVREYMSINHTTLAANFLRNKPIINRFGSHVRTYIKNELGVANAFTKE